MILIYVDRSQNIAERKRFVKMVEDVRGMGGSDVLIFSAMHESGHSKYIFNLFDWVWNNNLQLIF